jgi:hypothetical protein
VDIDEVAAKNFIAGNGGDEIVQLIPSDPKNPTRKLWIQYSGLRNKMEPLRTEFRKLVGGQYQTLKAASKDMPITSAIIETKPLAGGLEYSVRAGSMSGFGEAEYGFRPGQVTLDDVVKVHWVKDRQIISTGGPETIKPTLLQLKGNQ